MLDFLLGTHEFLGNHSFPEFIVGYLFGAALIIGAPLNTVNEKIEQGFIVLLEIEVEGAKQIKEKFPEALSIFLLPPSIEELEKRIRNRGTEKEESINKRLSRANYEIASSDKFDFVLTNHYVDETVHEIFKITKS